MLKKIIMSSVAAAAILSSAPAAYADAVFAFRHRPGLLPMTVAVAPDDERDGEEGDTGASVLRLSPVLLNAPNTLSVVNENAFEVGVEITNDGDFVVHDPEITIAFGPWGTAEAICFDTETILAGDSGFCGAQFVVADNGSILGLGRDPGEQVTIPITATVTGSGQSAAVEAVVTVGSHFVPRFTANLTLPDTTQRTVVEATPVLMSSEAEPITLPTDEGIADGFLPSANRHDAGWHEYRRIGLLDGDDLGEADMYVSRRASGGWEITLFRYDSGGFPYASGPITVFQIPGAT